MKVTINTTIHNADTVRLALGGSFTYLTTPIPGNKRTPQMTSIISKKLLSFFRVFSYLHQITYYFFVKPISSTDLSDSRIDFATLYKAAHGRHTTMKILGKRLVARDPGIFIKKFF